MHTKNPIHLPYQGVFSKSETMNMSRIYFFFLSLTYSCDISRRDQVTITMIYEMYTPTFFKVNLTNNPPRGAPPKKKGIFIFLFTYPYTIFVNLYDTIINA